MSQLAVTSPRWPLSSRGAIALPFLLMVAHMVVLFGLGGLIGRAFQLDGDAVFAGGWRSFVVLALIAALELLLVFGLLMRGVARLPLAAAGWSSPRGRDLVLGVAGFLACAAAVLVIVAVPSGGLGAALADVAASVASFSLRQRLLFVLVGALAAFTEETIFRGLLQPALQRRLGRAGGLVVTALVFALYHLKLRPIALLGKLTTGLVLGGLRNRTGTLWAPALAHALIWVVLGTT
jgi:membrane protease YdiL (CAAX protease family)